MSTHIRKLERPQINNSMVHLKFLEKQEQVNPKSSRQQEMTKLRQKLMKWRSKNDTMIQ
jgi:hypothetical protein